MNEDQLNVAVAFAQVFVDIANKPVEAFEDAEVRKSTILLARVQLKKALKRIECCS